jgi:hypothetical protein
MSGIRPSSEDGHAYDTFVGKPGKCKTCGAGPADFPHGDLVAWGRPETDPCERGTVGCSVKHGSQDTACETW